MSPTLSVIAKSWMPGMLLSIGHVTVASLWHQPLKLVARWQRPPLVRGSWKPAPAPPPIHITHSNR